MREFLLSALPVGWRSRLKHRWYSGRGCFRYFGERVYFPRGSMVFRMACRDGTYEAETLGLLRGLARPGSTIFDVGANIGLMSVALLRTCPSCRVVAFEPSPNSLDFLQRTHGECSFRDRWTLVLRACGDAVGKATFHLANPEDAALEGLRDTGRARGRAARAVEVDISTLDAEWAALGCPDVSVVKIDVEGAETLVLRGAGKFIATCRPAIVLEWNSTNLRAYDFDPDSLLGLADELGYHVLDARLHAPVVSVAHLRLQMKEQENFLLLPRD